MIPQRKAHGRGKELVGSVRRVGGIEGIGLSVGDVTFWTANQLSGQSPTPMDAFVTETEAADVEVGIRIVGREVAGGGGILDKEISGADEVTVFEIARDPATVHPTGVPVES